MYEVDVFYLLVRLLTEEENAIATVRSSESTHLQHPNITLMNRPNMVINYRFILPVPIIYKNDLVHINYEIKNGDGNIH